MHIIILAAGKGERLMPLTRNTPKPLLDLGNGATLLEEQIAGLVKEKKLPFIVRVTAEREPNALALPGGSVFVSWPLLEMCQWQRDEIAFVLGHEMAHIVRRHSLNRIVKDAALSLLLRQSSGRHAASAWLSKAGKQLLGNAYSREDELEADVFAVALVGTAGGDASAGERLLEKLAQGVSGQSVGIVGDAFSGMTSTGASRRPRMKRISLAR
jgi:Zn-dependent protease with chaperone function